MEALGLVVGVAIALLLLTSLGDRTWREVHSSPGHRPEETIWLMNYLSKQGIRCQIRSNGMGRGEHLLRQTVSLRVQKEDVEEAHRLMTQTGMFTG